MNELKLERLMFRWNETRLLWNETRQERTKRHLDRITQIIEETVLQLGKEQEKDHWYLVSGNVKVEYISENMIGGPRAGICFKSEYGT